MRLLLGVLACRTPPPDRVEIPGGSFTMGRDHASHLDERPAHRVAISPFALDATLVTVADFRRWVEATGHRTTAERLGFGMVSVEGMGDWEWVEVRGAHWRQPFGPEAGLEPEDDHPVTSVSWHDAEAYCRDHGGRLPTEAEWEYAMRAGAEGTRFPWGDQPTVDGSWRLNFWQGEDHRRNARSDGWVYTSPVRAFPPNAWGLYDPAGNAWQWTADWYAADTYARDAAGVADPRGPESGWARVARGGSWWCSAGACSAYGLFARGKSRPDSPYPNNSFRCAYPAGAGG